MWYSLAYFCQIKGSDMPAQARRPFGNPRGHNKEYNVPNFHLRAFICHWLFYHLVKTIIDRIY